MAAHIEMGSIRSPEFGELEMGSIKSPEFGYLSSTTSFQTVFPHTRHTARKPQSANKSSLDDRLDQHSFMLFHRLQKIYRTLNVLSALLAGLSLAVLTFDEFHPTRSPLFMASEGLLASSALSSVISVMLATMLLFKFEGRKSATRFEFAIAWSPLVILDVAIVEYIIALVFWYAGKNKAWRTALVGAQLAVLLGYSIWVAFWMYFNMDSKIAPEKRPERTFTEEFHHPDD